MSTTSFRNIIRYFFLLLLIVLGNYVFGQRTLTWNPSITNANYSNSANWSSILGIGNATYPNGSVSS